MPDREELLEPTKAWSRTDNSVTILGHTAREVRRHWVMPDGSKEARFRAVDVLIAATKQRTAPYDHLALSIKALCELCLDTKGKILEDGDARFFHDRVELIISLDGRPQRVIAYVNPLPDEVDVIFCDHAGNYLPHDAGPMAVVNTKAPEGEAS